MRKTVSFVTLPSWLAVAASVLGAGSVLPRNGGFVVIVEAKEAAAAESSSSGSSNDDGSTASSSTRCGLYLAPSSVVSEVGTKWGIYAGEDILAQTPVSHGDVAVHIFELSANNVWVDPLTGSVQDDVDMNPLGKASDWLEQFVWVPTSSGGQFELEEGSRIITAVPGVGLLGGFNPRLTNAAWNQSSAYHRDAWNEFPGVPHPGRGAYSTYYNLELATMEEIPAGKEIFIDYGQNWKDEDEEGTPKETLTKEDYYKIDQTIQKMIVFFEKYEADLDESSKEEIYHFLLNDVMKAAAGREKGEEIAGMLPSDTTALRRILETGGSVKLVSTKATRSLEWLDTHGLCFDNIRPGPSTVPYVGRGAFATRDIGEGGLVAPVPLIQIPDSSIFDMHRLTTSRRSGKEDEDSENEHVVKVRDGDEVIGKQLLLNYCWGHPESRMVFLPSGAAVSYINHSKDKINARMVWSDHPNNNKDWFEKEPADLIAQDNQYLGLMMEIVATKDIQQGDEIFLDYGDEWQAAWEEHVKEWKKGQSALPTQWPIQALDLNQEHKSKPLRVKGEGPAYPANVMIKCFLMVTAPAQGEPKTDDKGNTIRNWGESSSGASNLVHENLFDCELVSRQRDSEGAYLYDVVWSNGQDITIVKKVPQKAIVFLDRPGTGDQHLKTAFRHWVGIPDNVFPQGPWRDLRTGE